MKSLNAAEFDRRFAEILDEVQRQPIVIRRGDQDVAALVSFSEYERFRAGAVREFLELRNDIAREASAAGLTEDRLSKLLNND